MPYGGGGTDLSSSVPASPWPSAFENGDNYLAAAITNPFNAEQQIQDWGNRIEELSVTLPPMTQAQAATWIAFLKSLNGMVNVFSWGTAICAKFPETLTTNGTTPRYWRLKANQTKWSVKVAAIYGIAFELREAL